MLLSDCSIARLVEEAWERGLQTQIPACFQSLMPKADDEAPNPELISFFDWPRHARPNQLPPPGRWQTWLIRAGRGFGKTRAGAEWVRAQIESGRCKRMHLVAPTSADVRDTMVEGVSGILSVCPPWNRPVYEPSKRRLTWPNGSVAILFSSEEPDRLRGPQCDGAWADELAAWKRPETWDQLLFGLRLGENPQVCVTTTPRPTKIIKDLLVSPTTVETRGTTYENRDNLAPAFFERIVRQYEGTRLGRQEIEAVILDDNPGALWQRGTIERGRVTQPPVLTRIVVAIDPSGSSNEGAAEAGIVCAGKGVDGQGYVLSDRTLRGTPREWASEAVAEYHARQADRIVAEVNYGGEMVRMTVQTIDPAVPYKDVRASRGKQVRAEPIAALYEQNRVHHVGALPQLEDECCEWEPGAPSPNRMDALVWALTELMLDPAASDYASGYAFAPQSNPHSVTQQPRVQVRSGGGYAF